MLLESENKLMQFSRLEKSANGRGMEKAVSTDGGRTWTDFEYAHAPFRGPGSHLLLDDRDELSYPDGCENNGVITVVYDRSRGVEREIWMVNFTVNDIVEGRTPSINLISKGAKEI